MYHNSWSCDPWWWTCSSESTSYPESLCYQNIVLQMFANGSWCLHERVSCQLDAWGEDDDDDDDDAKDDGRRRDMRGW